MRRDELATVIARIKERCGEFKMTYQELSSSIGRDECYVADLCAGRNKAPSDDAIDAIASVLKCDVQWLRGRTVSPLLSRQGPAPPSA